MQIDSKKVWIENNFRFTSKQEAIDWLAQLKSDWPKLTASRVMESQEPVNFRFIKGVLKPHREPGDDIGFAPSVY